MSSLNTTLFESDWDKIAADLPQTMTFDGDSYTVIVSSVSVQRELQEAGIMPNIDMTIYIKSSDFTTLPTTGNKITYGGTLYRVVGYTDSNDGIQRVLNCKELMG